MPHPSPLRQAVQRRAARVVTSALLTLTGASVALVSAPAWAQSPEDADTQKARERFAEGRAAFDKGDYATAVARWEEAFAIKPNNKLLIYIGRAWFQLGKLDKALGSLERYAALGPEEAGYVKEELEMMRASASTSAFRLARGEVGDAVAVATPGGKAPTVKVEERLEIDRKFVEIPVNVSTEPPGAEVFVDSTEWGSQGTTPLNLKVFSGRHTIYVQRPYYEPQQVEITARPVTEGSKPQRVSLTLQRQMVQVELTTVPDTAEITLIKDDGESLKLGKGRFTGRLPAGEMKLIANAVGLGQREFVRTVLASEAGSDGVQRLELDMRSAEAIKRDQLNKLGTLQIEGYLIGADVVVDGKVVGQTPRLSVPLTPGPHSLEIRKEGFVPMAQVIRIEPDQTTTVETPETLQVEDSGVNWGGWLTLTAGLATAGAGGYFTWQGLQTQDEADGLTRPAADDTSSAAGARRQEILDLEDQADQEALISYILYGVGGAATITGIILLAVGGDDDVRVVDGAGPQAWDIAIAPTVQGAPGVGLSIALP